MNLLKLPDELLHMIASQVLEVEEGLRSWCRLATTCKRLWSLQLPSEPLHVLDSSLTIHGNILLADRCLTSWWSLNPAVLGLWQKGLTPHEMHPYHHAGVPWALRRLQEARKLLLTVSELVDDQDDVHLNEATAVMQASQALTNVEVLVRFHHYFAVCGWSHACVRSSSHGWYLTAESLPLLLAALHVL